jgi:site-specific DNA-methyltransferase (adenine-specific)
MALQKAMVSSKSSEHGTPQWLFNILNDEFHFTLDPCAVKKNAKCKKYFTQKEDGLKQDWTNEIVFVNPPYCRNTSKWVTKAYNESLKGATVVLLLSAATGRKWFHNFVFNYAAQIRWIKGFIKFDGASYGAPFASAVVIFSQTYNPANKQVYNYLEKEIKTWQ